MDEVRLTVSDRDCLARVEASLPDVSRLVVLIPRTWRFYGSREAHVDPAKQSDFGAQLLYERLGCVRDASARHLLGDGRSGQQVFYGVHRA